MKPVDFRNETFEQLRERLNEDRAAVHSAWLKHGPGTTRQVADLAGIDLLSFRPRTTELFQLGLLELAGKDGHQGVYKALSIEDWEKFCALRRTMGDSQSSLV
jgi:hypothetical protein